MTQDTAFKPLTIVSLNDYCNINGGASHVAITGAVGLAEAGHRVIFLSPTGSIGHELENSTVEVICLGQPELIDFKKHPLVVLQGLWNFAAYRRMKQLLKTLDPRNTVVHLHGYTKSLSTSASRCALDMGFKVICTLHDYYVACPNGALFDYNIGTPCPKRGLSFSCIKTSCDKRRYSHKLYRVLRGFAQTKLGLLPSGILDYILLSDRALTLLDPYMPKDVRYHPLDNVINVPHLPAVDASANKTIVAVGRIDVEKGIHILLEAARRTGIKLTLIGDGPLRAEAETLPNCRVTGWLSPEDVIKELSDARCLILPSLWYEGQPLVVTEAASRGVPAVVTDISASSERVVHGVHGWHVRAGDVEDLIRCLELTKDDETIKRMGKAAYDRFWKLPPTTDNHVIGLIKIYQSMLGLGPSTALERAA